jgi:transcriptional regulator with GAF, ATPase, and Fis domain
VKNLFKANADEMKAVLHELKTTGETLRAAQSKKDVIDFTIRIFRKLGFDRVRIWLVNDEKKTYYGAKASYMPDAKFQKAWTSLEGKVLPKDYVSYLKKKKPYLNTTTPLLRKFFGEYKTNYTVGFPLLSGKKLLGVISVDNSLSGREIKLSESETKIMPFVNHIALVLNRVLADEKIKTANRELKNKIEKATKNLKNKNETLEKLANYDQLTKLPNRRLLQKFLKDILSQKNKSFVYAMLDIDFLKHVNDTHGHAA